MRICAVTPFPPTIAGVADYGAFLVEEFARDPRVEHVTVLADRVAGAPEREVTGRIETLRTWERDRVDGPIALERAIARTRSDVVWFNLGLTMFGTRPSAMASLAAPLVSRLRGRPTVVTLHELPAMADLRRLGVGRVRGRLAGAVALRLLLGANAVVVTLERYRDHLVSRHRARNVAHIAHGTWERCRSAAEPACETVLVFGTFGPHKDPALVARAVARLRTSRPGLRLVVAGADHPRYPGFMAACRATSGPDASWRGYVERADLPALFADSTVVVVPARASTGSSGVIHRAVAHGRAVLVSDLPDFRSLAQEEDLALDWYASGDAGALARALERLLDDRARREAMSRHNMRSLERLAPRRTTDAYLSLFARAQRAAVSAAQPRPTVLAVEAVTDA